MRVNQILELESDDSKESVDFARQQRQSAISRLYENVCRKLGKLKK